MVRRNFIFITSLLLIAADVRCQTRAEGMTDRLSLENFASPSHSVRVGHPLTYTVKIDNVSSVNATDVTMIDDLPEHVTLIEDSLPQVCQSNHGKIITCDLGTIAPEDAPTVLVFEVVPESEALGSILQNQATVRAGNSRDRSATVDTVVIDAGPEISCTSPMDPLVWFPLDEKFGIISFDIAHANPGWHRYGPTFTAGKVEGALDFDGIDDYVEIAHDPSLSLASSATGGLSIALWIKTEGDGLERPPMTLLSKRGAPLGEPLAQTHGYRLDLSGRTPSLWLNDARFASGIDVPEGRWHHIAVTVDPNDPMGGRWYHEGVEGPTFDPSEIRGLLDSSAPLRIGHSSFDASGVAHSASHFSGALDEIQIFDRALTAEEVRSLFEAGSAGVCKETFFLASNTPVCTGEPSGRGDVILCNHSAQKHEYWINLEGIPAAECDAGVDGPTTFDLLTTPAQPVDVDPRSCQRVQFRVARPENMIGEGLNACYRVDVFNAETGFVDSRQASLENSRHWCAEPSGEVPVELPLGEDRVIAFEVANTSETSSLLEYEITTPSSEVSLRQRDELPDQGRSSLNDSVEIPAGESVTISAIAEVNEVGRLELPEVLLKDQKAESVLATSGVRPAPPRRNTLALHRDRFEVRVEWQAFDETKGSAIVAPLQTSQAGVFWFFTADNWEMLIKVLDGCSINQHFWVFAASATNVEYNLTVLDTHTGLDRSYSNLMGTAAPAITDVTAFATCSDKAGPEATLLPAKQTSTLGFSSGPVTKTTGFIETEASDCIPTPTRLCLLDGRFSLELDWRASDDETGMAQVVPVGSDDSGLLWFFHSDHWEMLVKVIDRCEAEDRYWMFAAATTDVAYNLRVTDTQDRRYYEYMNPLGNAADAIIDTFGGCP